ncbi:hypothetical protein ACHAWF_019002 [Thalassiosira exigua]
MRRRSPKLHVVIQQSTMPFPISKRAAAVAMLCLPIVAAAAAFQTRAPATLPRPRWKRAQSHAPNPNRSTSLSNNDDNDFQAYTYSRLWAQNLDNDEVIKRRDFIIQLSSAIAGTVLTPSMAFAEENTASDEVVEKIVEETRDLNADILKQEEDQKKLIEDEKALVEELEKDKPDPEKIREGIDELIKEEEQLNGETEEIITTMEAMEADLDKVNDSDASSEEKGFVEVLKESVDERGDFVAKLKRLSQQYLDPITGKYRPMSANEYRGKFGRTDDTSASDAQYAQSLKENIERDEKSQRNVEDLKELAGRLGLRYQKLWRKIQRLAG